MLKHSGKLLSEHPYCPSVLWTRNWKFPLYKSMQMWSIQKPGAKKRLQSLSGVEGFKFSETLIPTEHKEATQLRLCRRHPCTVTVHALNTSIELYARCNWVVLCVKILWQLYIPNHLQPSKCARTHTRTLARLILFLPLVGSIYYYTSGITFLYSGGINIAAATWVLL